MKNTKNLSAEIREIRNHVALSDRLATGGQPTEKQLRLLAQAGFEVVINLGLMDPRYCLADEAGLVRSLGMAYHHIPVEFQAPQWSDFQQFLELMDRSKGKKVFAHCSANYRVSCFIALYGQARLGWSPEQGWAHIGLVWEPNETWTRFIEAFRRQ
jgi:protein tyrosine phosphatase (PTP) superfamily phosphohydrolase (DUF442 family)